MAAAAAAMDLPLYFGPIATFFEQRHRAHSKDHVFPHPPMATTRLSGFRDPFHDWEREVLASGDTSQQSFFDHNLTPFQIQLLQRLGRLKMVEHKKHEPTKPASSHLNIAALERAGVPFAVIQALRNAEEHGDSINQNPTDKGAQSDAPTSTTPTNKPAESKEKPIPEVLHPSTAQLLRQNIDYGRFAPTSDVEHRHMLDYGNSFPISVIELEHEFVLGIDIPGVKQADLEIGIQADPVVQAAILLTVCGERHKRISLPSTLQGSNTNPTDSNTSSPPVSPPAIQVSSLHDAVFKFARSIRLPPTVGAIDQVFAHVEDGVLTITIPRVQQAQPRPDAIDPSLPRKLVPFV